MASDADYLAKENYTHDLSVMFRRGHLYSTIIRENREAYGDGKVLHIGCNSGTTTVLLKESYSQVFPMDINKEALRAGKNKHRFSSATAGNVLSMPFASGSFSVIYALDIIEHLYESDIDIFVAEMQRILQPGGLVHIFTPYQKAHNCEQHVTYFMTEDDLTYHFTRYFHILRCFHDTRENPDQTAAYGKHDAWNMTCQKL